MNWKRRAAEIDRLKRKHRGSRYKVPMPDLSIDNKAAPTSDRFTPTMGVRSLPADAHEFPIGNLHKQGPMLVTEGMIANGELKFLGGKKF